MPARHLTPICAALSFTVLSALAPQTVAAQPLKDSVIGFGAGALIGLMSYWDCREAHGCTGFENLGAMSAFSGGVIGAELGFIVGSLITGDRWESVPLRVNVTRTSTSQRAAEFRASVRLGF